MTDHRRFNHCLLTAVRAGRAALMDLSDGKTPEMKAAAVPAGRGERCRDRGGRISPCPP